MILVHFQGKSFTTTVIQVYASTTDAEEAEVDQFCEDLYPLTNVIGFLGGSDGKESACDVGDPGSVPGLGRSPGKGIGFLNCGVGEDS